VLERISATLAHLNGSSKFFYSQTGQP
jgi:hypothetical protein